MPRAAADEPPHDIELRLVDSARNMARVWACTEGLTLWNEPALVVTWGRIGHPLRHRLEIFATRDELVARRARLLAVRRRHGYALASAPVITAA